LIEKDETDFYYSGKYINHHCKECNNKKSKEWYEKNKEEKLKSGLKHHYKKKYGLSLEQRKELFDSQNGLCLVCCCEMNLEGGLKANQAVIDHCHSSGKIRGMLCNLCNQGLGHFKDNVSFLEKAIKYLEENKN
jgi:hypothetical protein